MKTNISTRSEITRSYRTRIFQQRTDIDSLQSILREIHDDVRLEKSRKNLLHQICIEEIDVLLDHQDRLRKQALQNR